jgi:hypothetical protein
VHLLSQAIQEAEIERITVPSQPGQETVVRPPSQQKEKKNLSLVAYACHPSDNKKHKTESQAQLTLAKRETVFKITRPKRAQVWFN